MVGVRLHVLVIKKRDRYTVKTPINDTSSRVREVEGGAVALAAVALLKPITGLLVDKNGPSFPIFLSPWPSVVRQFGSIVSAVSAR